MRRIFFTGLFLCLISGLAFGQEPADALRYSYLTGQGGTARNQALGGAGASLGGEFTSLFLNPAGLGFYRTSEFVVTPMVRANSNNANYLGENSNATKSKFTLSTTGFIMPTSGNRGNVRNVTVGFGINRVADFNNSISYSAFNNQSSYAEQYLEQLTNNNVTNPDDAAQNFPFGASQALNTYLIDTVLDQNGQVVGYQTFANPNLGNGLLQSMSMQTSGGITDASLGVGVNLLDKWYFGGSLSLPILRYERNSIYGESDPTSTMPNFNFFNAIESLKTTGVGVNGKFGVIYSPEPKVRIGLAFYTPTFYQLTDLYNMTIVADMKGYGDQGPHQMSSTDLNNGQLLRSRYNMTTPLRAILSGTYFISTGEEVQQQKGFVTADVEYVDYSKAAFHSASNDESYKTYYSSINTLMDQMYGKAINARVGAELKFNLFMVRFGGAYYGNPYQTESANTMKASGGVGYRNKGFFLDLAYTYAHQKDVDYPYVLQDKPNNPAFLNNKGSYITLTAGFKLQQ